MRISDWSSDVCSSDLGTLSCRFRLFSGARSGPPLSGATERASVRVRCNRDQGPCFPAVCLNRLSPAEFKPPLSFEWQERDYTLFGPPALSARCLSRYHEPVLDDRRERSEEHTSELQSLMRTSYAVFCL